MKRSRFPENLEWVDELPVHWRRVRLKFLAPAILSGSTPSTGNKEYWGGEIPWVSPKDMKVGVISDTEDHVSELAVAETNLPVVEPGHVLVVVRSGILRHSIPVALNAVSVSINQDMKAICCADELLSAFFKYIVEGNQSALLERWRKIGCTVESLEYDYYANDEIPLPPVEEQTEICRYLDRETSRIDALIEKKRRLLELLEEKRLAVITQAVTRGVDPVVPMKDSGIEWLGEVPAHWEVKKISRFLLHSPRNGVSPPITSSGTTPTFSITAVQNGVVNIWENLKLTELDGDAARPFLARRGDILVLRGNGNLKLVGKAGIVTEETPEGCIYPDILIRLVPNETVNPRFLVAALNSHPVRAQIETLARTAAGIWKISGSNLSAIELPVPPRKEQNLILKFLEETSTRIDELTSKVQHALKSLQEYRAALITNAVTGKIDVRGLAEREVA